MKRKRRKQQVTAKKRNCFFFSSVLSPSLLFSSFIQNPSRPKRSGLWFVLMDCIFLSSTSDCPGPTFSWMNPLARPQLPMTSTLSVTMKPSPAMHLSRVTTFAPASIDSANFEIEPIVDGSKHVLQAMTMLAEDQVEWESRKSRVWKSAGNCWNESLEMNFVSESDAHNQRPPPAPAPPHPTTPSPSQTRMPSVPPPHNFPSNRFRSWFPARYNFSSQNARKTAEHRRYRTRGRLLHLRLLKTEGSIYLARRRRIFHRM